MGTPPNGFTIGNRARKVALAAEGRVWRRCTMTALSLDMKSGHHTFWFSRRSNDRSFTRCHSASAVCQELLQVGIALDAVGFDLSLHLWGGRLRSVTHHRVFGDDVVA